jgi:hypothetical protein
MTPPFTLVAPTVIFVFLRPDYPLSNLYATMEKKGSSRHGAVALSAERTRRCCFSCGSHTAHDGELALRQVALLSGGEGWARGQLGWSRAAAADLWSATGSRMRIGVAGESGGRARVSPSVYFRANSSNVL